MLKRVSGSLPNNFGSVWFLVVLAAMIAFPLCIRLSGQNTTPQERELVRALNEKLSAAMTASQAGDFDRAINILNEAVQMDATRDLIWGKLGDAYSSSAAKQTDSRERTRRFTTAIGSYQEAIEIKRKAVENGIVKKPEGSKQLAAYYNNLSLAYGRSGDAEAARNACVQAVQLDAENAGKYYFNLGAILANADQDRAAVNAFKMVPANSPQFDKAQEQIEIIRQSPAFRSIGPQIQSPAFKSALSTSIQSAKSQFQNLKGKELARLDNYSQSESTLILPGALDCNVVVAHEPTLTCSFARSHSQDKLKPEFQQLVSAVRAAVPTNWESLELPPDGDRANAGALGRLTASDDSAYRFSGPKIEIWVMIHGSQAYYELKLSVVAYPGSAAGIK